MEFEYCEKINYTYDKNPIVLIDNSGSTNDNMNDGTILMNEIKKLYENMYNKNISEIYLMFWNSISEFPNDKKLININSIKNLKYKPSGSTMLTQALKKIPNEWFNNKETCDIYIYTDGEINDDPSKILHEILIKTNVHIITIEPNKKNYNDNDCDAGNKIYEVIRKNNLTGKVKEFVSYNDYHYNEPFITFNNPDIPRGYACFRNQIFKITKMYHFINYIETLISQTDKNDILKLSHDLSLTISHFIKGKSLHIQHHIINLFSDLFSNTSEYKSLRQLLLKEVNNHVNGTATTFQNYKRGREKVFENAQLSLYENVKQSISYIQSQKYLSFILKTNDNSDVIIIATAENVKEKIILANKIFNNAGFNIDNYNIPMLPVDIVLDNDIYDQCVRQWIRANYAKKYNINAASTIILYYFLADAMRVFLSNVSLELKNTYQQLVKIMLNSKRFGVDETEYQLLHCNPPGILSKINYILYKTMKYCGLVKDNTIIEQIDDIENIENLETNNFTKDLIIKPMTFWYAIILSFGDTSLIKSQYLFCKESLKKDNMNDTELINFMQKSLNLINEIDITDMINYDYTCYITLEQTDETGGYLIPSHRLSKNVCCSPKMVLSSSGYQEIKLNNHNTCPICYCELDLNNFKWIKSKNEILEESLKNIPKLPIINEPYYNIKLVDDVIIDESVYKNDDELTIYTLDKCNFNTVAYTINSPYIQEALGTRSIEVKTQEEFNKIVYFKYPFLKEVNFDNVVIAGGFCRSILLKQKMKDFDFFIHDENDNHMNIFNRLLKDTLTSIKKYQPNIKFLSMYKHLFNVYEVVCVLDPNNFFGENYSLDNFDKFNFKSLHLYDQKTIIDPESGKIYRRKISPKNEILDEKYLNELIKNKNFSNYFEDGDVNGIRMLYRLQFILTKNKSIENILNGFDLYPSRVAFDGNNTYFTKKSEQAYKYMINVINENNYSTLFDHRISKYFTYGFTIVLPELDINFNEKILELGTNKFKIIYILNNCIMVEHNSHLFHQIQSIEALEQKNLDNGNSLYKSTLFCSLVSLLRYIKINNVSYLLTNDYISPNEDGTMKFQESNEIIHFIDKIVSRIPNNDYYKEHRVDKSNSDSTSNSDQDSSSDSTTKSDSTTNSDQDSSSEIEEP